ncbi:MBOAT family O-acyltransferase [Spirosoma montaniterrae]|uniref:MBOAT family O-acyltransferase n=1 Tax=Spirosoma montaniterrae TaxID=1178516 RepID=UPI001E3550EC|nr:MBOAT family O-acyltransferase [Spirosoma montaniterrae]
MPILIAASLVFYMVNQADLLWLLLLSISVNIVASYLVVYGRTDLRLFHATWGVVVNLGILCFFKYGPLLSQTFLPANSTLGETLSALPLPVGISFFTFQGISLVVDTYRNRDVPRFRSLIARNLAQHAQTVFFFKAFFPQLISGPIVKAHFFLPQISRKYWADIQWENCFRTLVVGYFLKMVVADNLKDHTMLITYPYFEGYSSLTLLGLLFGYSMQIFADFAGYSLIALGLAGLFGYTFPANFNFPYVAVSFADFWRRWHISLSSFLREYLYIPLGGNRHGVWRTYLNLMLTMVLGGLWHGAAWSYAVWGFGHGLALALERFVDQHIPLKSTRITQVIRSSVVFSYVTLLWLLFKLPDFNHVVAYCRAIVNNVGKPHDSRVLSLILLYSLGVVGYHVHYLMRSSESHYEPSTWEFVGCGILLFFIITNSGSAGTFIYFQF